MVPTAHAPAAQVEQHLCHRVLRFGAWGHVSVSVCEGFRVDLKVLHLEGLMCMGVCVCVCATNVMYLSPIATLWIRVTFHVRVC